MRIDLPYGRQRLELDLEPSQVVAPRRQPLAAPLADPVQAVRDALEHPLDYPALRRALTPDDQVAIVLDEGLPRLAELLTPILEHLLEAQVAADAITLLCPTQSASQPWLDALPDEFQEVRVEVHDPANRKRLSYLATTKKGRRVYLNRSVIDADQTILLTRRGYSPLHGYSGGENALFPALSDEPTLQEARGHLSTKVPGGAAWPLQLEANEIAWLMGAPFLVQIIEGAEGEILHCVAGPTQASPEAQRLLDARWRVEISTPVDTVVAGLGGDPAHQGFEELAQAMACCARVVKPGGHVVLLTESTPELPPSTAWLRKYDEPARAVKELRSSKPAQVEAAFLWANAAEHARLYLLSGLDADVVEELFTTPLENVEQCRRLIGKGTCLVLPDAHKTLAVVREARP